MAEPTGGRIIAGLALLGLALAGSSALLVEAVGAPAAASLPELPLPHADKLLHFAAHLLLASAAFFGVVLCGVPPEIRRRRVLAAFAALALSAVVGIAVEMLQAGPGAAFGRRFDPLDILANTVGALLGVAVGFAVARRAAVAYHDGNSGG